MHEFALAEDIVKTIEKEISSDFSQMQEIELEVGTFAGVVTESLEFGLTVILKDKDAEHVKVKIISVPAQCSCECGHQYEIENIFQECPQCQSLNRSMNSGTDVIISSVEIAEE